MLTVVGRGVVLTVVGRGVVLTVVGRGVVPRDCSGLSGSSSEPGAAAREGAEGLPKRVRSCCTYHTHSMPHSEPSRCGGLLECWFGERAAGLMVWLAVAVGDVVVVVGGGVLDAEGG